MPQVDEQAGNETTTKLTPELAEGYYVDNFQTVLDTVRSRYDDLLTSAEQELASAFDASSDDARRLYVRLASRKGPCFRVDLLRYEEIADLSSAAVELERRGLLDRCVDAEISDLLRTLRRAELVDLARVLAPGTGAAPPDLARLRRPEVEEWLRTLDEAAVRRALLDAWSLVRPLGGEHILVYRLLFFGNLMQDFSQFVVSDLGIVRYESYPLERELRRYDERREVDDELTLRAYRQVIGELVAAGDVDTAVDLGGEVLAKRIDVGAGDDSETAWHQSVLDRADRVLVQVGRTLERDERLEDALRFYRPAVSPPARERMCRVLERLDRLDEAHAICRAMADSPRDETEAETAPVLDRRLRRKRGLDPKPRRPRPSVVELEIERDAGVPVETLVAKHLEAEGRVAIRSENWLWRSLFGLAFWDIVFAPVPGAFEHPFQTGPLDLHGPAFRAARRARIDRRLDELRGFDDLRPVLRPIYDQKHGLASSLVVWHEAFEAPLFAALDHVRGRHLALVADRLARDPGRYRRGLPDLLVARPGESSFELWEVKAPGDQLRPEQRAWLDHLGRVGIDAKVARVRWTASIDPP